MEFVNWSKWSSAVQRKRFWIFQLKQLKLSTFSAKNLEFANKSWL
jgi:hypothetical protein